MSSQRERFKVLGAGIFSLILVLGVARFAYTPLLPIMQQQAGLGLAEAGWLAALNYAGYLSGALIASLISDLVLKDRLYRIGLVVAIVSTAMMGLTTDPWVWMLSRFIAGLSSAAGMLLGTGLILNWLIRHNHRPELGIHFSGIGLGIAGCSVAVWLMGGTLDWREQWFAFTALGCLLLIPALRWLPAPGTHEGAISPRQAQVQASGISWLTLFGDEGVARSMAIEYLEANEQDGEDMKQALARQDTQALVETAHRIKGAARMVGQQALAEEAARLEAAARLKQLDKLDDLARAVQALMDSIRGETGLWLDE